jgi:hypothetical protein
VNSQSISDRCDALGLTYWDCEPLDIHATSESEAASMAGIFIVWISLFNESEPTESYIKSLADIDRISEEVSKKDVTA